MRHRLLLVMTAALALAGCGTNSGAPDRIAASSASARPSSIASTGLEVKLEPVRPAELKPGIQQALVDEAGEVHATMWGRPVFRAASQAGRRYVCLNMAIAVVRGAPLRIHGTFRPANGTPAPLPRVRCSGVMRDRIPVVVRAGEEADGVLGFSVPEEAGRLLLRGTHHFNYYVDLVGTPAG